MESRRQSKVEWLLVVIPYAHCIIRLFSFRLQQQLQVTPAEHWSDTKCIKFPHIYQAIQEKFPSESISAVEASRIIKEAFPSSQSKHFTSGNRVLGVQWKIPPMSNPVPVLVATGQPLGDWSQNDRRILKSQPKFRIWKQLIGSYLRALCSQQGQRASRYMYCSIQ